MRRGKVKWRQILALALSVAVVLTAMPQSTMTVQAVDMPMEDVYAGSVSEGDVSGADVSEGDASGGDVSGGDVSDGDVSDGDVSDGNGETAEDKVCLTVSSKAFEAFEVKAVTVSGNEELSVQEEEHKIYTDRGTRVEITIKSKQGYRLESVLADGIAQSIHKIPGEDGTIACYQAKFQLVADTDMTLEVSAKGGYSDLKVGYTSGGIHTFEAANERNGVYYVDRRPLNIYAHEKNSTELMAFGRAEILNYPEDGISSVSVGSLVDGDNLINCAWVDIASDLAGKRFQIALYEDSEDTIPIEIVSIKAASVVEKVSVSGVKKGIMTQMTNLTSEYALTAQPGEGVFCDDWKAVVLQAQDAQGNFIQNAAKLVSAEVTGQRTLKLITREQTGKAKVLIYNESALQGESLSEENLCKYNAKLAEFNIEIKAAAWLQKQPVVKFVKSSDTEIWFQIKPPAGFPADLSSEDAERYYYKVTAVEKGTDPASGITAFMPFGQSIYEWKVLPDLAKGNGRAASFQVTARLCYVEEGCTQDSIKTENILIWGKESGNVTCSTKPPCLVEKITLKRKNTVLYSGQEGIPIAAVETGKNATGIADDDFKVVKEYSSNPYKAWIHNGILYMSAYSNLLPDTYSIKVVANSSVSSAQQLKPVEATIQVKVLGGIATIDVQNDCEESIQSIYKQPGKAVSTKIEPSVSASENGFFPAYSDKVTYTLGYMDGDVFKENKDILGKGMLTLKKNVITVNKKYDPDGEHPYNPMGDNRFCVKITAADFPGNDAFQIAWFEIGTKKADLGGLVLIDELDEDQGIHASYLLDGGFIPLEVLDEAYVAVLRQDAVPDQDGWYAWTDVAGLNEYTLSSNQKLCEVWYDMEEGVYMIWTEMKALGKTVTFTATAKDGSGTSSRGSFKIGGLQQEHVGIAWDKGLIGEVDDEYEYEYEYGLEQWEMMKPVKDQNGDAQSNYLFVDPDEGGAMGTGTIVRLRIASQKEDGTLQGGNADWAYSISVSGGKIQYDMADEFDRMLNTSQYLKLIMTGKTAKITLKSDKKVIQTYTITNENYNKEKKSPKVSVVKNQKIYERVDDPQTLQFKMSQSVAGAVKVRAVPLTPDDAYFAHYFFEEYEADLQEGATQFNMTSQEWLWLEKGKVCFVFLDEKGTPLTRLSNTVALKVEPLKKSFKLTEKYTLSSKNKFTAELKYVQSNTAYAGKAQLINDIQKGQVNRFTNYFELDEDTLTLKLKEGLTELPGKADQTGYVRILVRYRDGNSETIFCKLTVNLKK